jgi:phosphoribosylaminoimidazole-succinocarboxamide synthase
MIKMRGKEVLMDIDLPFPKLSGERKDRKIFDFREFEYKHGLIVITDEISVFNKPMKNGIPGIGKARNSISAYWFKQINDWFEQSKQTGENRICPTYFITDDFNEFPIEVREKLGPYRKQLEGRSMLVYLMDRVLPIKCIVRQYLRGSAWKDYQKFGEVCGIKLESGFEEGHRFSEPIFTASAKARIGECDRNISFLKMCGIVGSPVADLLCDYSLKLFNFGAEQLALKGITLVDAKFEFGLARTELLGNPTIIFLINEVFGPDCCCLVDFNGQNFSKQPVRDYVQSIGAAGKSVELPPKIVRQTSQDCAEIYKIITNKKLVF